MCHRYSPCVEVMHVLTCLRCREMVLVTLVVVYPTLAFCATWSAFLPLPPPRLLIAARTARPAPPSSPGFMPPPGKHPQQRNAHGKRASRDQLGCQSKAPDTRARCAARILCQDAECGAACCDGVQTQGRMHERTRRLGLADGRAGRQGAEAARRLALFGQGFR